jgi:hypothetical protein
MTPGSDELGNNRPLTKEAPMSANTKTDGFAPQTLMTNGPDVGVFERFDQALEAFMRSLGGTPATAARSPG